MKIRLREGWAWVGKQMRTRHCQHTSAPELPSSYLPDAVWAIFQRRSVWRQSVPPETAEKLITQKIRQSINQSVNHSINQSINQSFNPIDLHALSQSINRSAKQSLRLPQSKLKLTKASMSALLSVTTTGPADAVFACSDATLLKTCEHNAD